MATNESGTRLEGGTAGGTRGTTTIANSVVSTIAGIAVRETDGVYSVGKGPTRALGAVKDKVSRSSDPGRGVKVEVGEKQTAVDVDIVVEYGAPVVDTAHRIRTQVTDAVETMTGLEVVEININVTDVHVPGSDDDEDEDESSSRTSRVR